MFVKKQDTVSESDQDLIKTFQEKGDLHALGLLYQRYMEMTYGLALKYFGNEEEAKDAVMDIFELLIKKLAAHDVEQFKSWLFVVSKNHCLQILRRRKSQKIVVEDLQRVYSDDFLHHDISYDFVRDHEDLYGCLKELSKKQRGCIELFYLEKNSYEEIAKRLGIEKGQVRSSIQNGRRNLKICMIKKEDGAKGI